jgi:hypothetical protein
MPMTNVGPLQLQLRAMRTALVRQMAANSEQVTRDQISELAAIETAIAAVQAESEAQGQRLLLGRHDDDASPS